MTSLNFFAGLSISNALSAPGTPHVAWSVSSVITLRCHAISLVVGSQFVFGIIFQVVIGLLLLSSRDALGKLVRVAQLTPCLAATCAAQRLSKPARVWHGLVVLRAEISAESPIKLHSTFNNVLFFVVSFHLSSFVFVYALVSSWSAYCCTTVPRS